MRFPLAVILASLLADPSFAGVIFVSPIDYPGTEANDATTLVGINDHDVIVGNFYDHDTNTNTPFVLDHGAFESIMHPSSYTTTYVSDINNDGSIVGNYIDSSSINNGFLDDHGVFTAINVPGASNTFANGINSHGEVVGSYILAGVRYGYVLDHGIFTTIAVPNATVDASSINENGVVVGDYELNNGTGRFGFIWKDGTLTTIAFPGAYATLARGINDHGDIVGYYASTLGNGGFLYNSQGFISVNDPLGSTEPSDINNRGFIIGTVNTASGAEGFIARIVPEPSTSFLLFSGLLLLWGNYKLRDAHKKPKIHGKPE